MLSIDAFNLTNVDPISSALQLLQYVGGIATAGSVLLLLSLFTNTENPRSQNLLWRQITIGAALLFFVSIVQVLWLLNLLFDGDWSSILSIDAMVLLTEVSSGQAHLLRLVAALLFFGFALNRMTVAAIVPLLLVFGSYLITGHTVHEHEVTRSTNDIARLFGLLLLFHVALISWWLAIIWPLHTLSRTNHNETKDIARTFGNQALFCVPVSLAAGLYLLLNLTNWQLDLTQKYQAWFLIKLIFVCGIMLIAALNKLRFGHRLNSQRDFKNFSQSLRLELLVAILILGATSLAINVGLDS